MMNDATSSVDRSTRLLLHAVLRDDRCLANVIDRSYWHPNGFAKLVLRQSPSAILRLHVWPPAKNRVGDTNPHTHVWRFGSTVLTGTIDDVHYDDVTDLPGDDDDDVGSTTYDLHRFVDVNARDSMTYQRSARLVRRDVARYARGDSYALSTDVIHTIRPVGDELTATLVRTERPTLDYALVYGRPGKDVAEPGAPLARDEGRYLLLQVLEAL